MTMIVRRTFVALAVAVVLGAIPATASAGSPPAASFYTKQQLQAMSQRYSMQEPASAFYTKQQLQVMSDRYAAKAAYDALTPDQKQALSDAWKQAGRGISTSQQSSGGFGWGDFGIGAAAMLGIGLLLGGVAVAARHSKSRVQPLGA
jgi:hypothetical protein